MTTPQVLELTEYVPHLLPASEFPQEAAEELVHRYRAQVQIEPPSFLNNNHWRLTPQGWVGHIPLTPDLHLALRPKVPLANLFRMLELVYALNTFQVLDGVYEADSLDDFFERLANILAKGVLDRFRRGIYRTYEPEADDLTYMRGRLDVARTLTRVGRIELPCHYEEHTADTEDNQILAWTLQRILRCGRATENGSLCNVRAAYRHFHGAVSAPPIHPEACVGRHYNRLNMDYRSLHALCYFFLSHTGPTHNHGSHEMLPFLVGMAGLYERFVAAWLQQHLAPDFRVVLQDRFLLDSTANLAFQIDMVVYAEGEVHPRWVLDTKYKVPTSGPTTADIAQVVAYATAMQANQAILIYPAPLPSPLDTSVGGVHVRSLVFSLDGDLDQAGRTLVRSLM